MEFNSITRQGRKYRYSSVRRISGRPAIIQFLNPKGIWRDVRNVDVSDWIWRQADAMPSEKESK